MTGRGRSWRASPGDAVGEDVRATSYDRESLRRFSLALLDVDFGLVKFTL